ncbi:MAG: histidine triad nucleotide-binding protein [Verrucomicrobiota bacterium]
MPEAPSLFEKIIQREISADIVHEDPLCIAFRDISPQAPVHILVVPKQRIDRISKATREDQTLLGHLLLTVAQIAVSENLEQGYRVIINNGPQGGESVPHLHLHLLGGRSLQWPPG